MNKTTGEERRGERKLRSAFETQRGTEGNVIGADSRRRQSPAREKKTRLASLRRAFSVPAAREHFVRCINT